MATYVERLNPREFSWSNYLDLAEVCARGFKHDELFSYAAGTRYQFGNDHHAVRHIRDPRDRLQELIQRSKNYKRLIEGWAELLQGKNLLPGCDTFILYKKVDEENEPTMVGMSLWFHPDYMTDKVDKELGRTGLSWWFKKTWLRVSNWVWKKVAFARSEHPISNVRFNSAMEGQHEYFKTGAASFEELSQMNRKLLTDRKYPQSSMLYLSFFVIDSLHQRQGLGSVLMNESLNRIPIIEPVFESSQGTSTGPQKVFLEASPAGTKLYKRYGFVIRDFYEFTPPNVKPFDATYMELVREADYATDQASV